MTDAGKLIEVVAAALFVDGYAGRREWSAEHETVKADYFGHARAALSAIEASGWAVVPVRPEANFITGHSPLDISDIEPKGQAALYVDGLTLDEAGALIRSSLFTRLERARPRITGETE